ncbi:MAG: hypothetical protein AAF502_04190 [Bacteroidota bacterium]
MKPYTNDDTAHLGDCLLLIEQKLNWGPTSNWSNQDFISLGEKIFDKTGVRLSHTTLKRVWGKVKYDSFPQTTTLNALARFLDYENWLSFKAQSQHSSNGNGQHLSSVTGNGQIVNSRYDSKNKNRTWQIVFVISILVFFLISVLNNPRSPGLTESMIKKISFSSEQVAEGIPNTVVFNYDVTKARGSLFEIQQSWDQRRRFEISPMEKVITSTYYIPGFFRAKLLVDQQIIKEHDVFIKSGGWLTTIEDEDNSIPRYLKDDEVTKDSLLAVSQAVIDALSDSGNGPHWMGFHYVEDMGDIDTDNFTFEASFKNTYEKGDGICRDSRIYILGSQSAYIVPLAIPGCAGDLRLMFSDVIEDGKTNDLSKFGSSYDNFQQLKLEVRDKAVTIYLNNKAIHQLSYDRSAGKLVGFRFKFKGSGEVDYVKVRNAEGQIAFEENFSPLSE